MTKQEGRLTWEAGVGRMDSSLLKEALLALGMTRGRRLRLSRRIGGRFFVVGGSPTGPEWQSKMGYLGWDGVLCGSAVGSGSGRAGVEGRESAGGMRSRRIK
jgi:hypothetical protein